MFRPVFTRRFARVAELDAISRQRPLLDREAAELERLLADIRHRARRLPGQIAATERKARTLRAELAALSHPQSDTPGECHG